MTDNLMAFMHKASALSLDPPDTTPHPLNYTSCARSAVWILQEGSNRGETLVPRLNKLFKAPWLKCIVAKLGKKKKKH